MYTYTALVASSLLATTSGDSRQYASQDNNTESDWLEQYRNDEHEDLTEAVPGSSPTDRTRPGENNFDKANTQSTKAPYTPTDFDWEPLRRPATGVMKRLIQVNCFNQGQVSATAGTRWMVPVDNTRASLRAFQTCLDQANPQDHIVIIHVREHDAVTLTCAYQEWFRAVTICRRYSELLQKASRPPSSYTILAPCYHDARATVASWAQELSVDTIVIGRHLKEDKCLRVKSQHWRSFVSYLSSHKQLCRTTRLVQA
eukprot:TRINITY_DN539_c0_g1_i2.p1 TRINITY_DN539_c0_g1~~TRINITY_DN539_c0_g1_i2.p1  ORF type:complete len:257 (+),score=28.34 TRINITY_DN539_c0_g1_i2:163-933(+)